MLSDEAFTDHTNVDVRQFSLHDFTDLNTINQTVYEVVSARAPIRRRRRHHGSRRCSGNGAASLNIARALAYGGYAYILLGEGFCEAPVNLSARAAE